jgi:hypothetical protein
MISAPRPTDWIAEAREKLIGLFSQGCGWGYQRDGTPSTEPTALACLALRATRTPGESDPPVADKGARWLASIQQPSGAVSISGILLSPEWATPYAILAWSGQEEYAEQVTRATGWLLKCKGLTFKRQPEIFGHDTTIVGWPWVAQTHSWLEPTVMAILALRRQGMGQHPRVREGLRLIVDRSISTGGWNYGNNTVYGTTLRPQPTDTGMALAALSGEHAVDAIVAAACAYLEDIILDLQAPQSLCWAVLGLTAWGRRPSAASQCLEKAYEQTLRRSERTPQLSYLLLAASDRSLELLGVQFHRGEANR